MAHLIILFLTLTAQKPDVARSPGTHLGNICRNLVMAAQGGGMLTPDTFSE
jgi:hypothetical protein